METKLETNKKIIDYGQELKKMNETLNYWKPVQGEHTVTFLSEAEECQYVEPDGKITSQWRFLIDRGFGPQSWTIPRSNSPNSVRGQLCKVAVQRGKLFGESLKIMVIGSGKERRYTVPAALTN